MTADLVTCVRCATAKPPSEFWPAKRKRNGLSSYCKQCQTYSRRKWLARTDRAVLNARRREAYHADPETMRARSNEARARRVPARLRVCRWCDQEFETRTRAVYCSEACRRRFRATLGDTPVSARVRLEVLDRDEWFCYLCMCFIDKRWAWPHPAAGTVDHVTPRSAGGSDDPSNLAAAHWACNQAKRDTILPPTGVLFYPPPWRSAA